MQTTVTNLGGFSAVGSIPALPAAPRYPPIFWSPLRIVQEVMPAPSADTQIMEATAQVKAAPTRAGGSAGWGVLPGGAASHALGGLRRFFYDQVFFDSTEINFGTVGADEIRQITVWNAFLTPIEFSDVTKISGDDTGITLSFSSASVGAVIGEDTLPLTLPSFAYLTITFKANVSGPPEISVKYLAEFQINDEQESGIVGADLHSVIVSGIRSMALIPFPNWANGMTEELEWMTNVVRTFTGLEHRTSLRATARRRLQFETLLTSVQASRMRNLMQAWQNRAFISPLWPYELRLSRNAAANQLDVVLESVDADTCGLAVGVRLILVDFPGQTYEFLTVESATADSPTPGLTTYTMNLPLKVSWPAGSYCYPAGAAFVEGEVQVSRLTADVESWSIPLLFDPSSVPDFMPAESAATTMAVVGSPDGSYEYLEQEPNWTEAIGSAYGFDALVEDTQVGGYRKVTTREFPSKTWQFSWLLKDRTALKTFRAFLARRKGMWKSFLAPSWSTDFSISQDIALGQAHIVCVPNNFSETVFSVLDKDFFIELVYGADKYRGKITGVDNTVVGEMRINVDFTFPVAIPYKSVRSVRLLEVYRLGDDKVAINWLNTRVATCSTSVTTTVNNRRV